MALSVNIADRGMVILAAKLVDDSTNTFVPISHRDATDIGVAPPAPSVIVTASNQDLTTPAAVTNRNVVLRFAVVLIDPIEDVDRDGPKLDQNELDKRKEMRAQVDKDLGTFLAGLKQASATGGSLSVKKDPLEPGEVLLIGGGAHDLVVSVPHQEGGISFNGTLTLRDLSGQKFDAKVKISITEVHPPCFGIVVQREENRQHEENVVSNGVVQRQIIKGRGRPFRKALHFYAFKVKDKAETALPSAKLELIIDAPEAGYRRQRIPGISEAGEAVWTIDGRKYGTIALPEKTFQILRASHDGYVPRNYFVFPKSDQQGTNAAVTEVVVNLWKKEEVGEVLKTKNFMLDPGHGIAYGAEGNKVRVQEWYVCDRALQHTRKVLKDWGVSDSKIAETRTAGILFDEYYWKLDFGKTTDNPRIYTISVNPDRQERFIDDLVVVLALDNEVVKQDFLVRNDDLLRAQARVGEDHRVVNVLWQDGQLGALVEDGSGNQEFKRLKVDYKVKLEFGRHNQRDLFVHLVETKLAGETMDVCLRSDVKEGEITAPYAEEAMSSARDYIKNRIVEQTKQSSAFDHSSSVAIARLYSVNPLDLDAPQLDEVQRPNKSGQWNEVLLGWLAGARINYWQSLWPSYTEDHGVIVSLHLDADDDYNAKRGCKAYYDQASSKIWAQLMAKYVDPTEGGMQNKVGYGPKDGGKTYFDSQATDVFIEAEFQNSVLGNFLAQTPHKKSKKARWLWLELVKLAAIERLGEGIAEAIAEGFCYPQAMDDWKDPDAK